MKSILSLFALLPAIAYARECQVADFNIGLAVGCMTASGLDLSAIPKDPAQQIALLTKACQFKECRTFFKSWATLTCTIGGTPASGAANFCDSVTPFPTTTTKPVTSTPPNPTTTPAGSTKPPTITPAGSTKPPTITPAGSTKPPTTTVPNDTPTTTVPNDTPTTTVPSDTSSPTTTAPTPSKPTDGIQVSVVGDATYSIAGPICSGAGAIPAGTGCPKKGDVAVASCLKYLPSFASGQCIAPVDAVCQKIPSGAWGCVWAKAGPSPTPATSVPSTPTTTTQTVTTSPPSGTTAPSTSAAPVLTQCKLTDFDLIKGVACTTASKLNLADMPKDKPAQVALLTKACAFTECNTFFKSWATLSCAVGSSPASEAANFCDSIKN